MRELEARSDRTKDGLKLGLCAGSPSRSSVGKIDGALGAPRLGRMRWCRLIAVKPFTDAGAVAAAMNAIVVDAVADAGAVVSAGAVAGTDAGTDVGADAIVTRKGHRVVVTGWRRSRSARCEW